jgi:hypothetical protein
MANLITYQLTRQAFYDELKKRIRILRTKQVLPFEDDPGDLVEVDGRGMPVNNNSVCYTICYMLTDEIHVNNLYAIARDYSIAQVDLFDMFPDRIFYGNGMYVEFATVYEAWEVRNRLYDYIY